LATGPRKHSADQPEGEKEVVEVRKESQRNSRKLPLSFRTPLPSFLSTKTSPPRIKKEDRKKTRPASDAPSRPGEQRLRISPAVVIAHTQPGLEGVAIREALARIPGARDVGRRSIADHNGMALLEIDRPQTLLRMRCGEDLFAVVGYLRPLASTEEGLEQARKLARNAPFVESALTRRVALTPGSRSGHRLDFRVVVRTTGSHEYRRVDLQKAIEHGISERGDRRWRHNERGEVEFWATLLDDELLLTIRLTDDRMRQRDYKVAHFPGSLRPSVAAAMAFLSQPGDDNVVLDPLCGAGTILIERAHLGRYKMLLGGDSDPQALGAARDNVGPRYKPIELREWDASALPIGDGQVTRIITNLPWGRKLGSHAENRRLYPRLLREFRRVLTPGGLMVLMTSETRLMRELFEEFEIAPSSILALNVLGAPASIYVCRFLR
jgi:SAM-dependent methyltransferase